MDAINIVTYNQRGDIIVNTGGASVDVLLDIIRQNTATIAELTRLVVLNNTGNTDNTNNTGE